MHLVDEMNASYTVKEGKNCIISPKVFICDKRKLQIRVQRPNIYRKKNIFTIRSRSRSRIYMSQCETSVQVNKYR